MITENSELSTITVTTDSKRLSCTYSIEAQRDLKEIYEIDISKEIEQLLNDEECMGYQEGEYTFSFANKRLSLHHKVLKEEIKNNLTRIMKRYCYEHNDEDTRLNITADMKNYFNMLHEKGAVYDYRVICDETNNTEETVQSNSLKCRVGIKFTKDSEFLIIDGMVAQSGTTLPEEL